MKSSASPQQAPAQQHDLEIHRNLAIWRRKPALRRVYRDFHCLLANHLASGPGATLELGSGIGSIKDTIPQCVTSDIFANPWLDRRENAYALSYGPGTVGNLILFDVWHHLEYPGTALAEFGRVLRPGGRLLIFDPDMGLTGRLLYGAFHHEPLGWERAITWAAPPSVDPAEAPYFAAQAAAYRIFIRRENEAWSKDWTLLAVHRLSSFAYLATGGFSGRQFLPGLLGGPVRLADRLFSRLPALFSCRVLIVLERAAPGSRT